MAAFVAFVLLAAAGGGGPVQTPMHVPTKAVAPALATVRILSGAKIRLNDEAQPEGYEMKPAKVTIEDGTRRAALLVEFQ